MAVLGDIAKAAQERIPATWAALSKREGFGEAGLQGRLDATKQELFGTVVAPGAELAAYGPIGVDYAGVVLALKLIPAGYDHWTSAATSWSASGRNENKTFIDRAQSLLKLRDEVLVPEEARLYPRVAEILVGTITPKRGGVLLARDVNPDTHVTAEPYDFEAPFERPVRVV